MTQIKRSASVHVWPTSIIDWTTGGSILYMHVHLKMWWRICEDGLPSPALLFISSQARQQILVWLDTLNRLGHGLISQEVLEELQALPWTVEGNLVPCTSDRHERQTLIQLAPSTNLQISMIHTITDMISVCSWEGNGTARFFFERSGLPADLMQWWCPRLTSSS